MLFRHKDKKYLVQCSVLYDVTRAPRPMTLTLSHLRREIIIAHDMASDSAAIAPLLKEDTATLTFLASKDGKIV
jgi:hypothetical protein